MNFFCSQIIVHRFVNFLIIKIKSSQKKGEDACKGYEENRFVNIN